MASNLILVGLGLAAVGLAGRFGFRYAKQFTKTVEQQLSAIPGATANSKYYRGGFEMKMTRREAGLILGISPSANQGKIKEAHKRIMLLNHPDKGGSPYLAAKINEAKDMFDSTAKSH